MNSKPLLLDLFCGAGGSAVGYARAGFDVIGVDIKPQPNYPFRFVQKDVFETVGVWGGFDAIHASPPCQAYSAVSPAREYPDLYELTREHLQGVGVPWIIENVIGAPYRSGFVLCGSMFGMKIRRHRNFECSFLVFPPTCDHKSQGRPYTITGNGGGHISYKHSLKPFKAETQAIPPRFTEWLGLQLIDQLARV